VFPVLLETEGFVAWGFNLFNALGDAPIMTHVHSMPEQWLPISTAPSDADLEVCVVDKHEIHVLVSPCRKDGTGWIDVSTKKYVDIQPTHWRKWTENH
jgi:hypothetical protein